MSSEPSVPRPRPCASCPFRCDVPAGLWAAEEYDRLPAYDAPMHEQPSAAFACHQADGHLCSGWLGYGDPADLLAVRLGVLRGDVDPSCLTYTTTVPLFPSATAAAQHGLAGVAAPTPAAVAAALKLVAARAARGRPLME